MPKLGHKMIKFSEKLAVQFSENVKVPFPGKPDNPDLIKPNMMEYLQMMF